jgi:D-3-phosphoglycerate dehydrogenase
LEKLPIKTYIFTKHIKEIGLTMKKKVVITQTWPKSCVTKFDEFVEDLDARGCEVVLYPELKDLTEADLIECMHDAFATICGMDSWTAKAMDHCPKLKIIARVGVGYDTIDVPAATQRGICVTITPGAGAETVSEEVLAMMLAIGRQLLQGDKSIRCTGWRKVIASGIYRKTLGIVGLGLIGKQLVKIVRGFDMKIIAFDKIRDEKFAAEHNVTYVELDELVKTSDYISIHTNLTTETRGLIGTRELNMMKPMAILVNAARGGIIDEIALYEALKARKILGAGLDVFTKEPLPQDHPLCTLDNVLLMPHNAGATYEGINAITGMAVCNVANFIDGKPLTGLLNSEVLKR